MAFELWTLKTAIPNRQMYFNFQWLSLPKDQRYSQINDLTLFVFKRGSEGETIKEIYRATHDSGSQQIRSKQGSSITSFNENEFKGIFYARGKEISWSFKIKNPESRDRIFSISGFGTKLKSFGPRLVLEGHLSFGDEIYQLNHPATSVVQIKGKSFPNRWLRLHCNELTLENGFSAPGSFEAVWAEPKFLGELTSFLSPLCASGPLKILAPTAINLIFGDTTLSWNKFKNFILSKSKIHASGVDITAEQGDYLLKATVQAELRTLAGILLQTTKRSVVYQTYTQFGDLHFLLYKKGKLEQSLYGRKNTSLDIGMPDMNPYVEYKN